MKPRYIRYQEITLFPLPLINKDCFPCSVRKISDCLPSGRYLVWSFVRVGKTLWPFPPNASCDFHRTALSRTRRDLYGLCVFDVRPLQVNSDAVTCTDPHSCP